MGEFSGTKLTFGVLDLVIGTSFWIHHILDNYFSSSSYYRLGLDGMLSTKCIVYQQGRGGEGCQAVHGQNKVNLGMW